MISNHINPGIREITVQTDNRKTQPPSCKEDKCPTMTQNEKTPTRPPTPATNTISPFPERGIKGDFSSPRVPCQTR